MALDAGLAEAAIRAKVATPARPLARGRGARHPGHRRQHHGRRHPHRLGRARPRPARLRPGPLRRRRAAAWQRAGRPARHDPGAGAADARRALRPGAARRRPQGRVQPHRRPQAGRRRPGRAGGRLRRPGRRGRGLVRPGSRRPRRPRQPPRGPAALRRNRASNCPSPGPPRADGLRRRPSRPLWLRPARRADRDRHPAPRGLRPPAGPRHAAADRRRRGRGHHRPPDHPPAGRRRCAAPILDRARLGPGASFEGPAILVQLDATTLVPPGWRGTVHPTGAILLEAATPA